MLDVSHTPGMIRHATAGVAGLGSLKTLIADYLRIDDSRCGHKEQCTSAWKLYLHTSRNMNSMNAQYTTLRYVCRLVVTAQ